MGAVVGNLIVFDDDETGDEGENGGAVKHGVDVCTVPLLFGRMGWLED